MAEWEFEHSVETSVSPQAAWDFWADVSNWTLDSALEWVKLDRPFAAGAKGITKPRGVSPGSSGGTRMTQRVSLSGPQAAQYVDVFRSQLAAGIPAGMRKLAEAMESSRG